jgi:hypothetical protein
VLSGLEDVAINNELKVASAAGSAASTLAGNMVSSRAYTTKRTTARLARLKKQPFFISLPPSHKIIYTVPAKQSL